MRLIVRRDPSFFRKPDHIRRRQASITGGDGARTRQRLRNDHRIRIDDLFTSRGIQRKRVSSTKVGSSAVEKLLKVIIEEKKGGGLFLSTYGFTSDAFEQLTTIDKQKLKFGDQEQIVTFCRTYVKAKAGLWSPPEI